MSHFVDPSRRPGLGAPGRRSWVDVCQAGGLEPFVFRLNGALSSPVCSKWGDGMLESSQRWMYTSDTVYISLHIVYNWKDLGINTFYFEWQSKKDKKIPILASLKWEFVACFWLWKQKGTWRLPAIWKTHFYKGLIDEYSKVFKKTSRKAVRPSVK